MHDQQLAIVKGLIPIAWADGDFGEKEREAITGILAAYGASDAEKAEVLEYAKEQRTLDDIDLQELSATDRRVLLQTAVVISFVDGDDAWQAIDQLEQSGRIIRRDVPRGGVIQHRFEPRESVDFSVFSQTEIATLYQVANTWLHHTTQQIEAATHGEAPWIAVKRNEIIPYHLAYYRNNFGAMDLDDDEISGVILDEDEVFAG